MFRRHAFVALSALTALTASGLLTTGCAEDTVATPRVTLNTDIQPGSNGPALCPESKIGWLTIGNFGNPALGKNPDGTPVAPVRPIDDGATDPDALGVASVSCTVTPAEDGFKVAATATLSGSNGGSVRVVGNFKPNSGTNSPIQVAVTRNATTYVQDDCVAQFENDSLQTVTSGRVWAVATCPTATAADKQRTCQTITQFRFENCGQ